MESWMDWAFKFSKNLANVKYILGQYSRVKTQKKAEIHGSEFQTDPFDQN